MSIPHTNWGKRRQELREQLGLRSWERDPPQVEIQLEQEKAREATYLDSLPPKVTRPTSARIVRRNATLPNPQKSQSKTLTITAGPEDLVVPSSPHAVGTRASAWGLLSISARTYKALA